MASFVPCGRLPESASSARSRARPRRSRRMAKRDRTRDWGPLIARRQAVTASVGNLLPQAPLVLYLYGDRAVPRQAGGLSFDTFLSASRAVGVQPASQDGLQR